MKIWIVQNGEELPSDPGKPRPLRHVLLATELATRGHEVTFWTTRFNHHRKVQRAAPLRHDVPNGFEVRLLPTTAYSKNVSTQRIASHTFAARSFRRTARRVTPPDFILAGFPTIELSHAAVSYGKRHGIPTLIDLRDQWPDIFYERLGDFSGRLARPLLGHWKKLKRRSLTDATVVTGVSDPFVDWGLSAADRSRTELDRAFHLAPSPSAPSESDLKAAGAFWDRTLGPQDKSNDKVLLAYAGSLSDRTDILTAIAGVQLLSDEVRSRLQFVICGTGALRDSVVQQVEQLDCAHFAGWRDAAEVHSLLNRADLGMIPYLESPDFLMSYPNKVGEMLSHGLYILSSIGGLTGQLLESNGVGMRYAATDPQSCSNAIRKSIETLSDQRRTIARSVFESHFDPKIIYPAYADHIEHIALQFPRLVRE